MPNPFSLTIAGVNGGADLITLPAAATPTIPFLDTGSFTATLTGDGSASLSFEIVEPLTPGVGPWWRSGAVNDNAIVKLFDSRYSASTPIFLGYVASLTGQLLDNGVGTRCSVSVSGASDWLNKTIVRKGLSGTDIYQQVGAFSQGGTATTDQEHINLLLKKVDAQVNDATTRGILNTAIISGTTRAIFSGAAVVIGKQSFKPGPLIAALDQIGEEASGECGSAIRYVVNNDARLEYGAKAAAGNISYANAPAQVSTGITVPTVGGTATATVIFAENLSVSLDHQQIIKGIFVEGADTRADRDANASPITNAPYFRTYNGSTASFSGAGLAARTGALPQQVFSAAKVGAFGFGSRNKKIQRLTRATFQVKAQPVRTVSFTVSGANQSQTSSPDWGYGFTQGYALDAPISLVARSATTATITTSIAHSVKVGDLVTIVIASGPSGFAALNGSWTVTTVPSATTFTFTTVTSGTITSGAAVGTILRLVKAWLPDQYVKITAPALGVASEILRISSVTFKFQSESSYALEYQIEADFPARKFGDDLRRIIGG